METDFIKKMYEFRVTNPQYFLTYGNIINNAVIDHIHQRQDASFSNPLLGYACLDENGWNNPAVAELKHRSFLNALNSDQTDKYKFNKWVLSSFERVSINCISWFGSEFAKFNGDVGIDEEQWLSVDKPKEIGKINAIFGEALCSHFAFFTQRQHMDSTDILQQYENILYPERKTCLVTGGAGFIGSNLVDTLLNEGHRVVVIDNESSDAHDQFYWNSNAINYKYDICNYSECETVFAKHKFDYVFHIAAEARIQPCIINPLKAVQANVVGTANMLELSRKFNVKRFMYSSTSSAYGLKNSCPLSEDMSNDCLNPYSVSKVSGEELCKMYSSLYNLETVIFRYFNVYGERQPLKGQYAPVIGIFQRQKKNNEPLTIVGDGEQRRDFTHVLDVVKANILAATKKFDEWQTDNTKNYFYNFGQIYNVGTGKNYSVNEIANMIGGPTTNIPARAGEARVTLANISKIKNHIGWTPAVNLKEWLQKN
jgi:UDP-glucose 4-epimerase